MHPAVSRYQQVRATTSSPGELLVALYDGLFRFLKGARVHLERGERARAAELLSKAYAVVSELYIALDHSAHPELCANLEGVYGFAMDRIMQANQQGSVASVDDTLRVLTPLREAWKLAVPKAAAEMAAERGR
ncbi:MAG: flagellar export chaperone FliS [Polyangiaceae bacterium]|nr:flagellar export chaperone FliS [Polyangiaceae bacterium]